MTVQGVKGNEKQNNWIIPTVAGAAIGGGVGATVLAPAKYKSFKDLVADATKDDKFEMPKAADGATDEVKKAFADVEAGVNKAKETGKKLNELFTGDTKEVEVGKVVKAFGGDEISDLAATKQQGAISEIVSKMKVGDKFQITDELKKLFPIQKAEEGKTLPEGAIKNADEQTEAIYEAVMGKKMSDDGVKFADGVFKQGDKTVTIAKETIENATEAAKKFEAQKPVIELMEKAEKGNVTREAAENFAKSADTAATEAFEKISKQLGKSRVKGGLLWGAGGLALGWLIGKFLLGKSEKSA